MAPYSGTLVPMPAESTKTPPRHLLTFDLGEHAAPFRAACRAAGQRLGPCLRSLVVRFINERTTDAPSFAIEHEPDDSRHRLELRLSGSELSAARALADHCGTNVQGLLLNLLRASVANGAFTTTKEQDALSTSSFQLGAIGRNLNQVVKRLNALEEPLDERDLLLIEHVQREIKTQIQVNANLVSLAQQRYRVLTKRTAVVSVRAAKER